jgi:RecA/RadA recombinase
MALPDPLDAPEQAPSRITPADDLDGRIVPTGFAALDAILGPGGLPRTASVALQGDHSSGKTTLALRLAAEAQTAGLIVAWLDLARSFDPVEAVTRGIRPEWLVVLTPADLEEALALSAALLTARTVDLLLVDLPEARDPAVAGIKVGDRLGRLAALARRAGTLLVVLEPMNVGEWLGTAVAEATGLRLELARRDWIRLGRDVVGQRTEVTIARNRFGPPGRSAELRILYAEGGSRDACLVRDDLLGHAPPAPPGPDPARAGRPIALPLHTAGSPPSLVVREGPLSLDPHATAPPPLASPAAPAGPRAARADGRLRLVAGRPDRPRRTAVDRRDGRRRGSAGSGARRPADDPARERSPARARGDLPRPRP